MPITAYLTSIALLVCLSAVGCGSRPLYSTLTRPSRSSIKATLHPTRSLNSSPIPTRLFLPSFPILVSVIKPFYLTLLPSSLLHFEVSIVW
ncbi:uncharacterized protein GGS22DRAFT_162989 [Annulohypoxylon maeteangense]|uniref:uncharacterized protein n=1 Tax=Annulohypoxylon maeteangense TaxID=1927788 RepID=UPI002007933D|nr:uncharacterized protein GGS22DRAFT_162989 [Annulohypoxylon maeteangense]KAI0885191.1 hypothetical protein GGS22DRAFT_162989 [Annulohypoxylon maeteangense]